MLWQLFGYQNFNVNVLLSQVAQLFGFQTFNEGPQPPAPPPDQASGANNASGAAAGTAGGGTAGTAGVAGAGEAGALNRELGMSFGKRQGKGGARGKAGQDLAAPQQPLSERRMLSAMGAGSTSTRWDHPRRPGEAAEGPQVNVAGMQAAAGGGDGGGTGSGGGREEDEDSEMDEEEEGGGKERSARRPAPGRGDAATPATPAATPGATPGARAAATSAPKRLWVPATAFVASDHLMHLLRDGVLRLSCQAGHPEPLPAQHLQQDREDRMLSRALYELHDNIFHSYATQW